MPNTAQTFQDTLSALDKYAHHRHSFLIYEDTPGKAPKLVCVKKRRLPVGKDRISRETLGKIHQFLEDYQHWFTPCATHERVLARLNRKFPDRLGPSVRKIQALLTPLTCEDPAPGWSQPQDVRIALHYDGGVTERWVHSELLQRDCPLIPDSLRGYRRQDSESPGELHLWVAHPRSLDLLLQSLYHPAHSLPDHPRDLLHLYEDTFHLTSLLKEDSWAFEDRVLKGLLEKMDSETFFEALLCRPDFNGRLAAGLRDYAARHFSELSQDPRFARISPSHLALILQDPHLSLPEVMVVQGVRQWLLAQDLGEEETYQDLLQAPRVDGKSLADLLLFEHLSEEAFIQEVVRHELLPPADAKQWTKWLHRPTDYPDRPNRMPRVPFSTQVHEQGRHLSLYWNLPVKALIDQHASPKRGFTTLAQRSFFYSGDQWQVEFCLNPFGMYCLSLRRLCLREKDKAFKVLWKWDPSPLDHKSRELVFSEGRVVEDVTAYPSKWLNAVSDTSGTLPLKIQLTRI